jgi:predicted Zn-dependent protease
VRVYADRDYQAQTPRWESHIEDQLDRANRVLEAQLSVRLQVESIRVWDRHGGLRGLESALADLTARDKAADVDWVIAFVSSLDVFSATHEQLGMAPLFSRHLVVRGISNAAEMDEIDSALDKLPREERASLARERRIHKETSVLLHEWAHTLGVFHDAVPGSLMAPFYEPSRSMFAEGAIRLLQAGLSYRNDRTPEGRAAWEKLYRKELADESAAFDAQMRAQATAAADQFFAVAAPEPRETAKPMPEPPPTGDVLSEADRATIAKVLRADDAGTPERAARLLVPVAAAHPGNARVQQLACYLALRSRPRDSGTARTCRDAAALPGARGEALLLAAQSALATGDRTSAVVQLSRAEAKLLADSAPKATWLRAAQIYDGAGTCSGAERALTHAADEPGAAQILSDCRRLRRLAALPASGIAIEREHEYVSLVQSAQREALSGRRSDAVRDARSLEKTFPGAPGGAVIACLVEGMSKTTAAARKSCEGAREAAPEAFLPRYVLALLDCAEGRFPDARVHLAFALELDDSTTNAWATLAAVQGKLGEDRAAADLAARYRKRFGADLKPAMWPSGWPRPKVSAR